MTHALLSAEQHLSKGFLTGGLVEPRLSEAAALRDFQTLRGYDILRLDEHSAKPTAMAALRDLFHPPARLQKTLKFEAEMKWLAENRDKYAGRWVALDGDHLLATGATSKDVFSKVACLSDPPLVIRIDRDDLPFAGW
ncbi:MAG: hypothetical protein EXQ47_12575 [Bryobacterales bacterium]|nr:hypothetical protein [Bryobacterales bacterium]